jgi:type II secretory ATPase GspE/PulE/Tfp pilus assembly ATPase PilB-like protein
MSLPAPYPMDEAPEQPEAGSVAIWRMLASAADSLAESISDSWIPIDRCGPLLVVAHFDASTPLPSWLSGILLQQVLVTRSAYETLLRSIGAIPWAREGDHDYIMPPAAPFPRNGVTGIGGRLMDLCRQLPMNRSELGLIEANRSAQSIGDLPPELRAAGWLANRMGAVAPDSARPVRTPKGIPDGLLSGCRVVAARPSRLWIASPNLPAHRLEDRLLALMPEGTRIEWILLHQKARFDGESQVPSSSAPLRVAAGDATGAEQVTLALDSAAISQLDPRAVRATGHDLFLWLLHRALREGASDLHIEPGIAMARARIRVHGELREILELPDATCRTVVGAAKAAVGLPAEMFKPLDGSFSVRLTDLAWNVRVSAMPVRRDYQKLVLRFLPRRNRRLQFDDLRQPAPVVQALRHASTRPQGLILVCGPTGSGKTTTLMTCLSEINSPEINLVTLEDPVEYEIPGLNQAEVDPARRVGWQELLAAVLRQDPDVVLIGEIRDAMTAEVALRAALTGHLVFATLHTLSSCKAVQRLLDLGVNPDMLAESLILIQSQRLFPRLCPECRVTGHPTAEQLARWKAHPASHARLSTGQPVSSTQRRGGCGRCGGNSAGRIAAMELVPVDDGFADLIGRRARALELRRHASSQGSATLFEAALALAASGEITWDSAFEQSAAWDGFQQA